MSDPKDVLLKELAAFPEKAAVKYKHLPFGQGCQLSADQRAELLSLANRAGALLTLTQAEPTPPAVAFHAGDEVTTTKPLKTAEEEAVPVGTDGSVALANADLVLVDFPQGQADLTAVEAAAALKYAEEVIEDDGDDDCSCFLDELDEEPEVATAPDWYL